MAYSSHLTRPSVALPLSVIFLGIAYIVGLAVYRLYFSPLAKFPGPKLAALSKWYEFYYEVIKDGKFTFRIQELHKQYGEHVPDTLPFLRYLTSPSSYEVCIQAQSSVSRLSSFMLKTAIIGMNSTPSRPSMTSTIGWQVGSGMKAPSLPLRKAIFTRSAAGL